MYQIRQFKPVLYTLVLIGLGGFCLAAESPGLWLLAMAAIGLNILLVATGRFAPIPRWAANGITIALFGLVLLELFRLGDSPILVIGRFLVLMQVVKLFEQRTNRDFAQVIALSLLLMVAAAISTASLAFGIILIGYLFLALYCCLLFYLKVETDEARTKLAVPEETLSPAVLRRDRKQLSRSVRRVTAAVSVAGVTFAVLVFVFFPRGSGANVIGPMQLRAAQRLTGFSEEVSYQNLARITQNTEVVGHVYLYRDGVPEPAARQLLLRGMTLDTYSGNSSGAKPWTWERTKKREAVKHARAGEKVDLNARRDEGPVFLQRIVLEPTGTRVLFGLAGPLSITPADDLSIAYTREDEVLQMVARRLRRTEYEVVSRIRPVAESYRDVLPALDPTRSVIDPRIGEYAAQIAGDLLTERTSQLAARPRQRGALPPPEVDGFIAGRIADHMQQSFSYTLDLTDSPRRDEDPIVTFLYENRRGHCELFAGAMTLMCQSLGIRARMVIGFRTDEYNPVQGAYIVRQSHAHAWVEVLTTEGWVAFDPTAPLGVAEPPTSMQQFQRRVKNIKEYLEFLWSNNVVAYDSRYQQNILQGANAAMTNGLMNTPLKMGDLKARLNELTHNFAVAVIGPIVGVLAVALLVALGRLLWTLYQLRKRADRFGLAGLGTGDRLRMARQLSFYDDLIKLLERHGIRRPRHLTPLEFGTSLAYLPASAYSDILRLTRIFYRVRYGGEDLPPERRRRLEKTIGRVAESLATVPAEPRRRRAQNTL